MVRPKFRLSLGLLLVLLVALDIAGFKYGLGPWGSGQSLNVYVMNAIPMTNILLLMAYGFAGRQLRPRPFSLGFFSVGLASLLTQLFLDTFFPKVTWPFYDSALEASWQLAMSGWVNLGRLGRVQNGYVAYFPFMVVVFAAPQFVAAVVGGCLASVTKRWLGKPVTTGMSRAVVSSEQESDSTNDCLTSHGGD